MRSIPFFTQKMSVPQKCNFRPYYLFDNESSSRSAIALNFGNLIVFEVRNLKTMLKNKRNASKAVVNSILV